MVKWTNDDVGGFEPTNGRKGRIKPTKTFGRNALSGSTTCKACGKRGLSRYKHETGMGLYNPSGEVHRCTQAKIGVLP